MHILLIHQYFAGLDDAGGTRHYELAQYLIKRGHRVTVIASPVSYLTGVENRKGRGSRRRWLTKEQDGPHLTILRTQTYAAVHRSSIHRVIGFLSFMLASFLAGMSVHQVDLVWGTSPPIFQGATAWALARLKRAPFLLEIRDLWPAFAIAMQVLRNPLLIRASLWLESFLYRHSDRVMVNSPGYIDHVASRGARWIELVPNGADPEMFNPQDTGDSFRRTYSLEGQFIALYAGAHGPSNDLGTVLEAAALLCDHPEICFVLLGDGKEKPNLQARAAQMGLKNVIFIPAIPKNEMSQALAAAGACIAILKPLELYKTTYPNKVFDYMAAGRPVILAIEGVIQKVIESAGAGIPVGMGNPAALAQGILKLSRDPLLADTMGKAGRTYLERNFSRSALAQKLGLLLEEMGG